MTERTRLALVAVLGLIVLGFVIGGVIAALQGREDAAGFAAIATLAGTIVAAVAVGSLKDDRPEDHDAPATGSGGDGGDAGKLNRSEDRRDV